ncbi:hypothetical protein CA54_40890 [Symmachiella macrocystis]|uniref:Uncharacterized protein n=1 Tax=Symmachiella macrocystis TaxID=2527985 RepID=A0A5C6BB07_9PLAN|nr:DUF1580 domain-containing protein [Symmachiella macrocystis]TWU08852.1 hypothetical protein CA54_40890 [Symmachiella macrocystis]
MTTVSTSRDVLIDPFGEDTEPISQICKSIPGKPSAQTVWRWIVKGRQGVFLKAIPIGREYATNREAVTAFLNAVGDAKARNYGKNQKPAEKPAKRGQASQRSR